MKKMKNAGMAAIVAILMVVSPSFNECPPPGFFNFTVLLPNPADCSTFFSCSDGVPILMHCPNGLHFNAELDVCDWPADAGCDVNLGKNFIIVDFEDKATTGKTDENGCLIYKVYSCRSCISGGKEACKTSRKYVGEESICG